MQKFVDVERKSKIEELILEQGVHVAAHDLYHAMYNVKEDAEHVIKDFAGTPAHLLMVKQLAVLKEAYDKINKLRATIA